MAKEYRSAFGVLGLRHDMKLRTYESFVRERLAGYAVTTPLEAHFLLGGHPQAYTPEACRATMGLLLIFGFEPRSNGKFHRAEVWEEDFQVAERRQRRAVIDRLDLNQGSNAKQREG
jgi:hypothetical protein